MKKSAVTLHDSRKRHFQPSPPVELADQSELMLERAVLRLNANILGLVLGIIAGLIIFVITNFLILKGGAVVGPHLGLLSNFFPYYSVTLLGSLVGLFWGLVFGYVAGFVIGSLYNLVVKLKSSR
jgi:hypothetical protein